MCDLDFDVISIRDRKGNSILIDKWINNKALKMSWKKNSKLQRFIITGTWHNWSVEGNNFCWWEVLLLLILWLSFKAFASVWDDFLWFRLKFITHTFYILVEIEFDCYNFYNMYELVWCMFYSVLVSCRKQCDMVKVLTVDYSVCWKLEFGRNYTIYFI